MEKITGYVDRIIYRNDENGYTVLSLVTDEGTVQCTGPGKGIAPGENLILNGEYVDHPSYGHQFKYGTFQVTAPKGVDGIERYLSSGAIKGIGAALAKRIIEAFGEDSFRIIEEEPERLAQIRGISRSKAREIAAQMEEKRDLREAIIFLQQYGISNKLAVKIYDAYGSELYGVLQENPYRLAEDISGIGFKIADDIAAKIGIHTDSDYRIRCGIQYTLLSAVGEGHCYLPMEELLSKASYLLGVAPEAIEAQLSNLMMDRKIIVRQDAVFAANYFYAELNCARMLFNLNQLSEEQLPSQEAAIRKKLEKMAGELSMELDELQLRAVMGSICNGVFLLSGGPGTGKTTTINMMIRYFESQGLNLFLAAPTGRAAKRMTEATGYEARTIHRMLELNSALSDEDTRRVRFERNESNPLDADVIIIDEMSMVDILLFQSLLRAITPGTRVILVGDVNQLPSVGPGQVLRDLLDAGCFPMVELKRIFRQAEESDIIMNAHRINRGEQISLDTHSQDFFFLERSDARVICKHMIQLIQGKLPAYVEADPFEIQVLTPMRKGPLGCETLNGILQEYLNPPGPGIPEVLVGDTLYRRGDKVMQVKNDYQLEWEITGKYGIRVDAGTGVFNGDMGRIVSIDEAGSALTVEYDEKKTVRYPFSLLDELELAYAITIHKSQGSEYPGVLLPLLGGSRLLFNRNLLYTAITRAKRCVTILGSSETVRSMIENTSETKRYTALTARIREIFGVNRTEE